MRLEERSAETGIPEMVTAGLLGLMSVPVTAIREEPDTRVMRWLATVVIGRASCAPLSVEESGI